MIATHDDPTQWDDPDDPAVLARIEKERHSERPGWVTTVLLSTVKPEHVSWLWPDRIPLGKLTIIEGDPSAGKSTLTADMAAVVTTGRAWPDGTPSTCGTVLLLTAEDGLADTVAPRVLAAGGDVSMVTVLQDVTAPDDAGKLHSRPLEIPGDVDRIEAEALKAGAVLIIVDVLNAYLGDNVKTNNDHSVRRALGPLAAMAERVGAAVVVIRHLNKGGGTNALYRGGGSIGLTGAARSVLLVGRDPEDTERRVLAVSKSNLAREAPSLAYRLVDVPHLGCARVEWEEGAVSLSARDLLAPEQGDEEDSRSALDEAKDVLCQLLAEGPLAADVVEKKARQAGVSRATLRRAKAKLKVRSVKRGRPDGTQGWDWVLPGAEGDTGEGAQGIHSSEVGALSILADS